MKLQSSPIVLLKWALFARSIPVLILALPLDSASPAAADATRQTIHTHVPEITAGLQLLGRLPATNRLHLSIGLPLRDQAGLDALLHQLYNPASTNFHRFLTPQQFADRFGPLAQDYQKLILFTQTNQMDVVSKFGNRAVLGVSGTVAAIERTFHVKLGTYRHPTENRLFYAPDVEPSVDLELPVLFISELDNYVIPRPAWHKIDPRGEGPIPAIGSGPTGNYWGYDFRHAYAPDTSLTGAGQVVGLFTSQSGYASNDIATYENLTGLGGHSLVNIQLPGFQNNPGDVEPTIDIEMAISMAPGISVNVYQGPTVEAINEIASANLGEALPNQISSSYEIGGEANILQPLMQIAAQGQSFFLISGDGGGLPTSSAPNTTNFNYTTVVGGTRLSMNGVGGSWQSEIVWNGSGGGVYLNAPIPDYQLGLNMSGNQGSTQNRNTPDVAMCAVQFDFIYNGQTNSGLGGTSFASPLWAGFAALVNQQAATQAKPPVGFLNPSIYYIAKSASLYAACFHDIVSGNNTNAGSPNLYSATTGYDLCTGWGSPTGKNLIDALTSLAGPIFVDFNYTGSQQDGSYDFPFNTLAGGINKVSNYGTIFIKTAGSSRETMTITKPMTITAINGAATVGHQ